MDQILAFRVLEKGDDTFIPKEIITEETELISATKLVKKKKKSSGGGGSGNTDCVYDLYYQVDLGFNCEPLKRGVGVEHLVSYLNGIVWNTSINSDWIIDWGDGSSENSNSVWHDYFTHTYTQAGTYTIGITVTYFDPCGFLFLQVQDYYTETIIVEEHSCSNTNYNMIAHDENGSKRMTSEVWVKHDMFGEHQVADTKSYEWNDPWIGSSGWQEEDANVLAEIYWTFRDAACFIVPEGGAILGIGMEESGLETDWCSSCQHKRAGKTNWGQGNLYVMDDEVYSHHKVVNEGIVLERTFVISTCN